MFNTGAYKSYDAVTSAWTYLLKSKHGKKISEECVYLKFPGRGQRKTPCTEAGSFIRLLKLCKGKLQEAYRIEMEQVLERYLDGDTSMCVEIQENKRIGAEAARESFALKVEARAAELEEEDDYYQQGIVYGMVSEAFPGLVKIGRTNDLEKRLTQANTFCAPAPFRVANYGRISRRAHGSCILCRSKGRRRVL
jgi:hypothetical protein